MKKKVNVISLIVGLVFGSSFLVRTFLIYQAREAKRQEVAKVKDVQKTIQSIDEKRSEEVKKQLSKTLSSALSSHSAYEKYTQIDNQYALGVRAGAYYLVTLSTKEERLLEGVDQAFSTTYKDEDSGENGVALLGHKDGAWHILDEKGETIITLEQTDISPESKMIIKNNTVSFH
ncbi:hypothetical protein PCY06_07910 [Streptococcus sp. SG1]|uniref:hypothetical protein n=1 Tax=Streptococcus TaxID=1301 RepID=UPI0009C23B34|nr:MULTISPECIES: hypothetical protein [Streptococcus]ARC47878.1 hypothetical protein A6J85_05720 [Streptococcus gordonii]MDN5019321.1 hypothetical protein [Streptococcus sp. SG1]MDU3102411.1 hypothetical protein [Streptococcus sp.]RSJ51794.1 hypothetical protein D8814_05255 [Streptococcus gordonii]RSJ62642.1 hypothetical protein D8810_05110 [Streptococcus gordonii]